MGTGCVEITQADRLQARSITRAKKAFDVGFGLGVDTFGSHGCIFVNRGGVGRAVHRSR